MAFDKRKEALSYKFEKEEREKRTFVRRSRSRSKEFISPKTKVEKRSDPKPVVVLETRKEDSMQR